jgi:octanoyl-[GcvH]:protein N-octanoyltransferase
VRPLHVLLDCFPYDPALDTAVSRATMQRVAAGELPETLRLIRPARAVAFAKRDALAAGYRDAVEAAHAAGFESVMRLAGGRAAVFSEETLELAHAVPDPDARSGIQSRFESTAGRLVRALARLGVDARVGEVPGEYCPGAYSVNARGRVKLIGTAQRLVRGGALLGASIVVGDGAGVRAVLDDVYAALEFDWDATTAGAIDEEVPGLSLDAVETAVIAGFDGLELGALDEETLALARRLEPQRSPA